MLSFRHVSLDQYKNDLGRVLSRCDKLFEFGANKSFRKWRFKTYIYSQKALNQLCKLLTGGVKKTCIGIGDWSRRDGGFIKGHPPAPVKKIQRELRRHATVLSIDKYRTSKRCSSCEKRCLNIKWWKPNPNNKDVKVYLIAIPLSVVVPTSAQNAGKEI